MSLLVLSNFNQEAVNTPCLQMIKKALCLHCEGSPRVMWTRTIGLGAVECGLGGTPELMQAGRGQIAIWTTDTDFPNKRE